MEKSTKNLVHDGRISLVSRRSVSAVKTADFLQVDTRNIPNGEDIGYVGEIREVNPKILV